MGDTDWLYGIINGGWHSIKSISHDNGPRSIHCKRPNEGLIRKVFFYTYVVAS